METLKELLALLGFGPENIQAVLYISLASVFVPQLVKRSLPNVRGELLAAVSGGAAGAFLWSDHVKGALVGVILGAFWTAAYKPLMRLAYQKWPALEDRVSAKPSQKAVQTPTGIVVRDITQPSASDEKTLFVGAPTEAPDITVPKVKPEPSNE